MLLQKSTPILVITVLANWGIAKDYEWTNSIGGTSGDVAVESAIDASTCNNYTWSANGNNYTSSGIYTATLTANQNGASYQWIDCISNTAISGATNQLYTTTTNGEYQVQITLNGCTESSSCIVVDNVALDELVRQSSALVYPNPTDGPFTIQFGEEQSEITVEIYTVSGQLVQSLSENGVSSISIDSFTTGMYLLAMTLDKGRIETHKLIVR